MVSIARLTDEPLTEPTSPAGWVERVLADVEAFAAAHAQTPVQGALLQAACASLRAQSHGQEDQLPFVHLPMLVHAALQGSAEPARPLAVVTSLSFLGIDILDDLADGDRPAHWGEYSEAQIALTAHTLLSALVPLAIAQLDAPPGRRVLMQRTLAQGLLRMGAGQLTDLATTGSGSPDSDAVEGSVTGKSGEELAMFAALGAQLADAPVDTVAAWAEFGRALGSAGQLASDCYDLFRDPECRDLVHGARTLPVAWHLQRLTGAARDRFLDLLARARVEAAAQEQVRDELRAAGALRYCAFVVELYRQRAQRQVDQMYPPVAARAGLQRLVDFPSLFPQGEPS